MTALPLPQSDPFLRGVQALGWPVARASAGGRDWIETVRALPGLGRVRLISRGPADGWDADWLAARSGTYLFNPEHPAPTALRGAGFWPVMTPATVAVLPLADATCQRAGLAQKWRNRLNRAEASGLRVRETALPARPDHWLLTAEAAQARARGYRGWPPALSAAIAARTRGAARLLTAERRGGAPIAGLVLILHAPSATYQIGWSGAEGRACNAMTLLLWRAMRLAVGAGCSDLDLGTLDTRAAPGLAQFKLGTGALPQKLGGSWLRHAAIAPVARRLPRWMAA